MKFQISIFIIFDEKFKIPSEMKVMCHDLIYPWVLIDDIERFWTLVASA